jgi:hypothetical protein
VTISPSEPVSASVNVAGPYVDPLNIPAFMRPKGAPGLTRDGR